MLFVAFNYSTDFFKTFDKFRRALTIITRLMFIRRYLHPSELYTQVFDKLLVALTIFELVAWILR